MKHALKKLYTFFVYGLIFLTGSTFFRIVFTDDALEKVSLINRIGLLSGGLILAILAYYSILKIYNFFAKKGSNNE